MQCMQKDHSSAADKPPEVLQVPDSVLQGLAESQQPAGQITGTNHADTCAAAAGKNSAGRTAEECAPMGHSQDSELPASKVKRQVQEQAIAQGPTCCNEMLATESQKGNVPVSSWYMSMPTLHTSARSS